MFMMLINFNHSKKLNKLKKKHNVYKVKKKFFKASFLKKWLKPFYFTLYYVHNQE